MPPAHFFLSQYTVNFFCQRSSLVLVVFEYSLHTQNFIDNPFLSLRVQIYLLNSEILKYCGFFSSSLCLKDCLWSVDTFIFVL